MAPGSEEYFDLNGTYFHLGKVFFLEEEDVMLHVVRFHEDWEH